MQCARSVNVIVSALAVGLVLATPVKAQDRSLDYDVSALIRERATYRSAVDFDRDDVDAGWFWTQRLSVDGDVRLSPSITGKMSLVSVLLAGIESNPTEQNNLDVQQAYLDFGLSSGTLRLGRQELAFGSQRLISTRDGTGVRRTWDGLRYTTGGEDWSIDALALWLVDVEPNGAFNDELNDGRMLAGAYWTRGLGAAAIDVYYLYSRSDDRPTIQGVADQRRHSLGARVFGSVDPWFWDSEAIVQFGEHGDDEIRAWTLATNTGYRFDSTWSPEVMLSVNVASGDDDPTDSRLETFDALYPRGSYFSEAAILGPSNFYNINPYVRARPMENLSLSLDVNWFWRLQEEDAVYNPPGVPLRLPSGSSERFVARAVSFSVAWEVSDRWFLSVVASHSKPQAFIRDTGADDEVRFLEFTVEAVF